MAVQGKLKEGNSNSGSFNDLYCGMVLINSVLAINPSAEERAELMGYEYNEDTQKEHEFVGTTEEGDKKVDLFIYLEGHIKEMKPIVYRVTLEDRELEFKNEDTGVIKYKFCNQLGQTYICENKNQLPDWFTHFQTWSNSEKKFLITDEKKAFRKCLAGEDKLIAFMREALSKVDQNDPDSSLSINLKDLFRGKVKELLEDLQGPAFRPFVDLLHITTNKDGDKQYQNLYIGSNTFYVPSLPPDALKFIRSGNFPTKQQKNWEKYKEDANGQYGAKGHKIFTEAEVYDASTDMAASNEVKKELVSDNSDY